MTPIPEDQEDNEIQKAILNSMESTVPTIVADLQETLGYNNDTKTLSRPPTEVTIVTSMSDEVSEHSEITNNDNPVDTNEDIHTHIVKLKVSRSKMSMGDADRKLQDVLDLLHQEAGKVDEGSVGSNTTGTKSTCSNTTTGTSST